MSIEIRNPDRVSRILHLLYRIWNKDTNKGLRLMQLLSNALIDEKKGLPQDFFYVEDELLEQKLKDFYNEK